MDYLRDPDEIYRQSFATIEAEADLSRFDAHERQIATRIIHACGMVEVAEDLVFSDDAVASGIAAIRDGAPIICDVRMVEHGIIARYLNGNSILTAIAQADAKQRAETLGTTVSAGGMDSLKDKMRGAVVAIGNAPTALFHLLETVEKHWPKPALVLGFPVGFVGAVESKAALIANTSGVPYIALKGRRGGSAMAAAAVNALLIEAGK